MMCQISGTKSCQGSAQVFDIGDMDCTATCWQGVSMQLSVF